VQPAAVGRGARGVARAAERRRAAPLSLGRRAVAEAQHVDRGLIECAAVVGQGEERVHHAADGNETLAR
jgi:hypothetical protein